MTFAEHLLYFHDGGKEKSVFSAFRNGRSPVFNTKKRNGFEEFMSIKKTDQKVVFSNITTSDDLTSFLNHRGKGHTAFYQYTDLSTLEKILKGKKILLSRADTLNDFYEGGHSSDMKNIFIASFSFFYQESIGMWSMYACPYYNGVRLKINGASMRKMLNAFNGTPLPRIYLPDSSGHSKPIDFNGNAKLYLMDVLYMNNKNHLEWYNYRRSRAVNTSKSLIDEINNSIPGSSLLNWGIKNSIWATEIETRLILKVDPSFHDESITRITIDFSLGLQDLQVMSGPCLPVSRLRNSIKKCWDTDLVINESIYYNKTFFKSCKDIKWKCENRTHFCEKRLN